VSSVPPSPKSAGGTGLDLVVGPLASSSCSPSLRSIREPSRALRTTHTDLDYHPSAEGVAAVDLKSYPKVILDLFSR
jgi:hypothetical protein